MHYYQFNIGDYSSHTKGLSLMEDLAYRRLLDAYYLAERPLHSGIASVARQIGMREYETEVKFVLECFFALTEDGWIHARADKEILHYHSKIEQASKAGRASAERRSGIRSTDVQPTNNQEPITNNQKPVVEKRQRATRLPKDFVFPKEWADFCVQQRPDLNLQQTFDSFKDYWVAAPKGMKLDWMATWRNWVRSQAAPKTFTNKFDVVTTTTPPPPNQDAALKRILEDDKKAVPPSLETLEKLASLRRKAV